MLRQERKNCIKGSIKIAKGKKLQKAENIWKTKMGEKNMSNKQATVTNMVDIKLLYQQSF